MSNADKNKNHSAHYLLSCFIKSPERKNYDIDASDIGILFVISTYIDMNKKDSICFARRTVIAEEAGISPRKLTPRLHKLCSKGLLNRIKVRKSWHYELGYNLTDVTQKIRDERSPIDHIDDENGGRKVPYIGDERSLDQGTKGPLTIDYKNKIIKNDYIPLSHTLSPTENSEQNEREGGGTNENNFDVEIVRAEFEPSNVVPLRSKAEQKMTIVSDNLLYRTNISDNHQKSHNYLSHENYPLKFQSQKFDKFYSIHPNPGSRRKALKIWIEGHLEEIADDIILNVEFRLANDANWVRNIAAGTPNFISQAHTYLATESWGDKIITIGEIENAKNSGLASKLNDKPKSAAQRATDAYRWATEGDDGFRF